jgi:hypothetical protein
MCEAHRQQHSDNQERDNTMIDTATVARTTRPADGSDIVAAALAWRRADIAFHVADVTASNCARWSTLAPDNCIERRDDAQFAYNEARRKLIDLLNTRLV